MSQLNVDTIKKADGTGNLSVPAETGTVVTTASPSLGRRNIILNGSMAVAQRGTSSTTSGIGTVDRFNVFYSGGTVTQTQESLSSGDPYDEGFRNFLRATVTSAGSSTSADYCYLLQYIEAQNMANSGWNYTSSSSYSAIQFWVRSSVAGTYYCVLRSEDGTNQGYVIPVTLSANTWTKVTHTIPGGTNVQFDNNNGAGLELSIRPFVGTNYSDPSVATESWYTRSGTTQTPDYTHGWQQTSSATFDLTGVQLEVGSVATPFEHRSYGEELALCQRYYYRMSGKRMISTGHLYNNDQFYGNIFFPVEMRDVIELSWNSGNNYYRCYSGGSQVYSSGLTGTQSNYHGGNCTGIYITLGSTMTRGDGAWVQIMDENAWIAFDAEL
jgi:hypothetical protein